MAVVLCGVVPEPNFTLDKENLEESTTAGCPSVDIVQTQSQNRKRQSARRGKGRPTKSWSRGEEEEEEEESGGREPRGGNPGAQWVLHFFSALLVWAHGGGQRLARIGAKQAGLVGHAAPRCCDAGMPAEGRGRARQSSHPGKTSQRVLTRSAVFTRCPLAVAALGCGVDCGDWGWVPNPNPRRQ
jgi:hypothetical protein